MNPTSEDTINRRLRSILVAMAQRQDDLAAREEGTTGYCPSCHSSLLGHRTAAALLRAEADCLSYAS